MRIELSALEVLSMYENDAIIDSIIRDDFYREELVDLIKSDIKQMDKEDQDFYSDLNDEKILIRAFRENVGDSEIVTMFLDKGWAHDLAHLIDEDYRCEEPEYDRDLD